MANRVPAFRKAAFCTLGLSIPALFLVCSVVTSSRECILIVRDAPMQILVAFAMMSLFVWLSAPACAAACSRRAVVHGLFFVLVFLIGSLVGSATSMIVFDDFSLFDYVVKPLYWLSLFGIFPAFLLGIAGWYILRSLVSRGREGINVERRHD